MTLLRQIQDAAADSEADLPTLLRRTKILATRLQNEQLRTWVDKELDGYARDDSLPSYRVVETVSVGNFSGPFGSGVNNAQIPSLLLPEAWRGWATIVKLRDGVSSYIENLKSKVSGDFKVFWQPDHVAFAQHNVELYDGMVLSTAWRQLPRSALALLLDSVRNRVLSLALELEQEAPDAGEAQPGEPPIPPDVVASIVNNTIFVGNHHIVAVGSAQTQQTTYQTVYKGDFDSLVKALRSLGVADTELEELSSALSEDPIPVAETGFGPRTKEWLDETSRKVAGAAGNAALSTAFQALAKAVAAYAGVDIDLSTLGGPT